MWSEDADEIIDLNRDNSIEQVLEFQVIDTGIGIKESDQEKLFTLFGKLKV